jgi:hypothetical protein
VLRTFEDPNDYLIYVLHTLGFIQSSENERNPAFFTFFWFLAFLVMDDTALTNNQAQILRDPFLYHLYNSEINLSDLTSKRPYQMCNSSFLNHFLTEFAQPYSVGENTFFRLRNKNHINVVSP